MKLFLKLPKDIPKYPDTFTSSIKNIPVLEDSKMKLRGNMEF